MPFPVSSSSPGEPIFLGMKSPIPMAMMTLIVSYSPLAVLTMIFWSPSMMSSTFSFSLMSHSMLSAWA